jgi:hypothetical protein
MKKTRRRCIWIDDPTWKAITVAAKAQDRAASSWVREVVKRALIALLPRQV